MTDTIAITLAAGSNGYVGVCVVSNATSIDITNVTVDGVGATQKITQLNPGGNVFLEYWERAVGSTSGSINVVVTSDVNDRFSTTVVSMKGVDQGTPSGTILTSTAGTTSESVSLTAGADDLSLGCFGSRSGTISAINEGGGQLERWDVDHSVENNTLLEGSTEPGANPTVSVSWTGEDVASGLIGVPVKAAAATRRPSAPIILGWLLDWFTPDEAHAY